MRILVTVCHYYFPEENGKYASLRKDPRPRIGALRDALLNLRLTFGGRQLMLDILNRSSVVANREAHDLDIIVCTTKGRHLLDQLDLPEGIYRHHATDAEPMYLGYECHSVLRENIGLFDYYCYIEDDIVVLDSQFFTKLAWFNSMVGPQCVLMPQRYEVTASPIANKVYIDGFLRERAAERFQNRHHLPEMRAKALGREIVFRRPNNPHAGSFFITAEQMRHWAAQPYFLDRSKDFVSPLESAATLGIMRTFRIYKTTPECADFLEVQHYGVRYHKLIGTVFTEPQAARRAAAPAESAELTNAAAINPVAAPSP